MQPPIDADKLAEARARALAETRRLLDVAFVGGDASGFHLSWVSGGGFGMLAVRRTPEGAIECDNEGMGRGFVLDVVSTFARQCPRDEWPELLAEYGSAEVLVGAAKPTCGQWNAEPEEKPGEP